MLCMVGSRLRQILFYDHILSIDDEVEYIWNARLSAPKIAFMLVRYIMPAVLFVNAFREFHIPSARDGH